MNIHEQMKGMIASWVRIRKKAAILHIVLVEPESQAIREILPACVRQRGLPFIWCAPWDFLSMTAI